MDEQYAYIVFGHEMYEFTYGARRQVATNLSCITTVIYSSLLHRKFPITVRDNVNCRLLHSSYCVSYIKKDSSEKCA